ncbi:alkaline phosphatase [Desulfoplanes formicivorans]|uniref:Alkaline phosphatase n=1 Tax=Desulfoplanes formicivorans TaxID=1592317 RepID=A0A194AJT3_9BACT|nr:alkaline phosphatase [Desulfoplanes formicivorans]GAU08989.1 alkaline phosphatase [Desulfoplanes formicivorans]
MNKRTYGCWQSLVTVWMAMVWVMVLPQGAGAANAKYVFLFIGDGMGIAQRALAAKVHDRPLRMDGFPVHGVTSTYAADRFITDSAAAGTALACGRKTNVGMIGMDPEGHPLASLAAMAKDKGMKVGLISSVSLNHSTPAAFYAHVPQRKQYYDISMALAASGFDFLGGGGLIDPDNVRNGATVFQGNAWDVIQDSGYRLVTSKKAFMALEQGCGKVYACNSWLPDHGALPYAIDARSNDISLAEFTAKGIELLDNDDGFFLMVEGGKIDWACHAHDAATAIGEILAFDAAIDAAHAFYTKHPAETLIVVTADHECGGLSLGYAGTGYASLYTLLRRQRLSFQQFHDRVVRPIAMQGMGWETARSSITRHFPLQFEGDPTTNPLVVNDREQEQIRQAFDLSRQKGTGSRHKRRESLAYGGEDPLTVTLTHVLNHKAGLGWATYKHTATPVMTSALGVGAEAFGGYYDNTDIAQYIARSMGLPCTAPLESTSSRAAVVP